MGAVLLDQPKRPARDIVLAARLPSFTTEVRGSYRSPWQADGDVVAECDLCGYGCQGARDDVGKAMKAHHAMFHSESIGVVLLNQPRQ